MIITRYLFREILHTLLALVTLLLLIYVSHRFMVYLVQASMGALPAEFIFQLVGIKLLSDLMLILPLGFFLAILLALGRLYKDNEIAALEACGLPVPFMSILMLSGLFALFVAMLSLFIAPWAQAQKDILQTQLRNLIEIGGITAGRFKEFNQGNGIFYVERIDSQDNTLHNLFVQVNLPNRKVIMVAQQGHQIIQGEDLFLVLVKGQRYENKPGTLNYIITNFVEHRLKIPRRLDTPQGENQAALPTERLWTMKENRYWAELQWRFSLPFTVILLTALAIPLAHTTPRQGQYAKVFIGILIYLIYNNLLSIAKKWFEQGKTVFWLGIWWVHVCLILIIVIFVYLPVLKLWFLQLKYKVANLGMR